MNDRSGRNKKLQPIDSSSKRDSRKKVLLLHGNRQTGELLLGRMDRLEKALLREFELDIVAPDAPHLFSTDNNDSNAWQRTWWHHRKQSESTHYQGLEETLSMLNQLWSGSNNHDGGGFVAIMGFSQGSRLAHIMSLLHTMTKGEAFPGLECIVHFSGFGDDVPILPDVDCPYEDVPMPYDHLYSILKDPDFNWSSGGDDVSSSFINVRVNLPSLHVMGTADAIVPLKSSEALLNCYVEPLIHVHQGGHFVPVKKLDVEKYLAFFKGALKSDSHSSLSTKATTANATTNLAAAGGRADNGSDEQSAQATAMDYIALPNAEDAAPNAQLEEEQHASDDYFGDMAPSVLCHLIESGKVITSDANDILRHLIGSGKISTNDASDALKIVRNKKVDCSPVTVGEPAAQELNGTSENSHESMSKNNNNGTTSTTKKKKPAEQQYRTRHVVLQFSYDGTEYSGFAQKLGKKSDCSVEKTLWAALRKTRFLVSRAPEEGAGNGMGNMVSVPLPNSNKSDGGEGGGERPKEIGVSSSETVQYSICGRMVAAEAKESENKSHGGKSGGGRPKEIDEAFSERTAVQYSRCGRTDAGVHAHRQVVALYLRSAFPPSARNVVSSNDVDVTANKDFLEEDSLPKNSLDGLECLLPQKKSKKGNGNDEALQLKTIHEFNYPRILNNVLPPSIRVLGWCPVSSEFSARFSCSQRVYRYFFPRRSLDLSAMALGLQYMMGHHDFRNFCKMNIEQECNFKRVLMSGKVASPQTVYVTSMEAKDVSIEEVYDAPTICFSPHDMCHVEIVGQTYLWHQIRCIMTILFYIGRGLEQPELVQQLLDIDSNPAKPSYELASETALVLHDCKFGHLDLGRTVSVLWGVTKALEQRWEAHAVAAARAMDEVKSIKKETQVRWEDVTEFVLQIAKDRRRKEQKRNSNMIMEDDGAIERALEERAPISAMISWEIAIQIIQDVLGVSPHRPNGISQSNRGDTESSVHVPLLERAKGTTYEEKVKSILGAEAGDDSNSNGYYSTSKRKARYEEFIVKKKKTEQQDKAFYDHMLRQGGSCG